MAAAIGTYTNWFTSSVTATASLSWRLASLIATRQSPVRLAFSLVAALAREGFKVKADALIQRGKDRSKSAIFGAAKLSVKKTLKWAKRKKNPGSRPDAIHDVVAVDAGMKYKDLARRRLNAARAAFEAATTELREAERGMKDAERYVKSLRSRCRAIEGRGVGIHDIVFVEQANLGEGTGLTGDGLADDLVLVE